MTLILTSSAFVHGGEVPAAYTCQGKDISPPLAWDDVPAGTESLALILDDPDAPDPDAPKLTWVHWVVLNLPPDIGGLAEDADGSGYPGGAAAGLNDWNRADYGGPCPPVGRHRYFHKLYALDMKFSRLGTPTKAELEAAMAGHVLGQASLMGTYRKT